MSPQTDDDTFMQLGPQMVLAVFGRFVKYVGEVRIAATEYEKIVISVAKVKGCYMALTISKESRAELEESVTKIFEFIREIQ